MGLSYHKSFKLFGNTKLNVSTHGGIGLSTGVKGARISANRQGVRTSIGRDGLYYRKQKSWKNIENNRIVDDQDKIPIDPMPMNKDRLREFNTQQMLTMIKALIVLLVINLIIGFVIYAITNVLTIMWVFTIIGLVVFFGGTLVSIVGLIQANHEGRKL